MCYLFSIVIAPTVDNTIKLAASSTITSPNKPLKVSRINQSTIQLNSIMLQSISINSGKIITNSAQSLLVRSFNSINYIYIWRIHPVAKSPNKESEGVRFCKFGTRNTLPYCQKYILTYCFFGDFAHWATSHTEINFLME